MKREEKDLTRQNQPVVKVVDHLPDYQNDPVMIRQLEEAYRVFEEAPLPDFLAQRAKDSQ
ncbi:hypothetical protein [Puia dinghuensis]|uniref:Uncharacterized protein n=1 Tax=Puia dinghuensis TaxID=1792502 RepID=A0A8J2UF70_9BACT|nr:hypothetical protein [Puia dinghuensis]GGB09259.1 hypothetical protein GCM10011511_35980 [Puia dinghuensis]